MLQHWFYKRLAGCKDEKAKSTLTSFQKQLNPSLVRRSKYQALSQSSMSHPQTELQFKSPSSINCEGPIVPPPSRDDGAKESDMAQHLAQDLFEKLFTPPKRRSPQKRKANGSGPNLRGNQSQRHVEDTQGWIPLRFELQSQKVAHTWSHLLATPANYQTRTSSMGKTQANVKPFPLSTRHQALSPSLIRAIPSPSTRAKSRDRTTVGRGSPEYKQRSRGPVQFQTQRKTDKEMAQAAEPITHSSE
jgi:hypothetical protein